MTGSFFSSFRASRWLRLLAVFLPPASTGAVGGGVTLIADIPFATQRHERLVGDFFLPENLENARVALVIHGGGWMASDKTSLAPVARGLAEQGIAAFSINYRRITEAPWPACLEDCLTGLDRLMEPSFLSEYGLKADRVMVVGASAGGHLALMAGLSRPGKVSAIIAIAPPTRMEVGGKTSDSYLFSSAFFGRFFGTSRAPGPASLSDAAPFRLVGEGSPPLWLVHSRKDELVPPFHSEAIAEEYRHHGRQVRIVWFNGTDSLHGLWKNPTASERVMSSEFAEAFGAVLFQIKTAPR